MCSTSSRRSWSPLFFLAVSMVALATAEVGRANEPADAQQSWKKQVDALVDPAIENKQLMGLVVGISTAGGERLYFSYGKTAAKGQAPDSNTIFEIGSISKPITCLMLARLVEMGEMKLDDPVRKYFPQDFSVPRRGEREITLAELATHTSGLPPLPLNLVLVPGSDLAKNPYRDFDSAQLRSALSDLRLDAAPSKPRYSNFGAGVLGEAIVRHTGKTYESLLHDWIAQPLGMRSTFVEPTPELRARMAVGHDRKLAPTPDWTFKALVGAGGIRSTAADLLNLLEAENGRQQSELDAAMLLSQKSRTVFAPSTNIGLGWMITQNSPTAWWHNGGTGGFASYAAFCREPAVAVVVLSNKSREGGGGNVDRIGEAILRQLVQAGAKK